MHTVGVEKIPKRVATTPGEHTCHMQQAQIFILLLTFKFKFYRIVLTGISISQWVTRFTVTSEISEKLAE
jgi:hypothetical protein